MVWEVQRKIAKYFIQKLKTFVRAGNSRPFEKESLFKHILTVWIQGHLEVEEKEFQELRDFLKEK